MKKILVSLAVFFIAVISFAQEHYLLIGTYTSPQSEGIYVFKFNSNTGAIKAISTETVNNASYLALSPDEKYVYAVNESGNNTGAVSSYSFDKITGKLTFINKQPSNGDHPCYVAVHKSGKWVAEANYNGGNFSVYPVMANGSLGTPATTNHEGGSYSVQGRQDKPHVHSTVFSPDYKYLFVSDLGMDKIMAYSFNAGNGKVSPAPTPFMQTSPGAGPRHFTFHPNGKYAYLVEELSATVSAYSYKDGKLTFLQRISALPDNFTGTKGAADIHVSPDGKFLYSSNRGTSNTIAIFSIDQATGKLKAEGYQSTLGKVPRNFNFDPSGNFLLVGNQDSDEIVIFKVDKKTGKLTDTEHRIEVGKPVCIIWAKIK